MIWHVFMILIFAKKAKNCEIAKLKKNRKSRENIIYKEFSQNDKGYKSQITEKINFY